MTEMFEDKLAEGYRETMARRVRVHVKNKFQGQAGEIVPAGIDTAAEINHGVVEWIIYNGEKIYVPSEAQYDIEVTQDIGEAALGKREGMDDAEFQQLVLDSQKRVEDQKRKAADPEIWKEFLSLANDYHRTGRAYATVRDAYMKAAQANPNDPRLSELAVELDQLSEVHRQAEEPYYAMEAEINWPFNATQAQQDEYHVVINESAGPVQASKKAEAAGKPTTVDMGFDEPTEVDGIVYEGDWGSWWAIAIYTGAGVDSFLYLVNASYEQDALDALVDADMVDRYLVDEDRMAEVEKDYLADHPEDINFENLEENLEYYISFPIRLGNASELFDMNILHMEAVPGDMIQWGSDKPQALIEEEEEAAEASVEEAPAPTEAAEEPREQLSAADPADLDDENFELVEETNEGILYKWWVPGGDALINVVNSESIREALEQYDSVSYGTGSQPTLGGSWADAIDEVEFLAKDAEGNLTPVAKEILELNAALTEYPVLDDEAYSRMQYERALESIKDNLPNWYSIEEEDPDVLAERVWETLWNDPELQSALESDSDGDVWVGDDDVKLALHNLGYQSDEELDEAEGEE